MYTGINMNENKKFVSKNDPDKDNPTVFHLGVLDSFVKAYIEDNSISFAKSSEDPNAEADVKMLFAKRNLLVVKFGLRKIENFCDLETGKPITIDSEKTSLTGMDGWKCFSMPDKDIAMLAKGGLISELASEILKLNSLSGEEAKN